MEWPKENLRTAHVTLAVHTQTGFAHMVTGLHCMVGDIVCEPVCLITSHINFMVRLAHTQVKVMV